MKLAHLHPKARIELQDFPEEVRRDLGKAIFDLQRGAKLAMPLSRPMPSVGAGVEELRVKDRNGAYRVFYYTKLENVILVFHAFVKKSQKTPQAEIELGKKRLKEILNEKE
jgi:phage-related protein